MTLVKVCLIILSFLGGLLLGTYNFQKDCPEDSFPTWKEVEPGLTMYDKGYNKAKEECGAIVPTIDCTPIYSSYKLIFEPINN